MGQNQRFFVDLKKKTTIRVGRMDTVNHDIYRQYLPPLTVQRMAANANAAISLLLDQWDGAVFYPSDSGSVSSSSTNSFAVYFEAARMWFDEARTYTLTEQCWIPLLSLTDMIARHAATRFFHGRFSDLQRKYREYLHLLMLNNLMRGPAVSTQSGDRWLIPAASYSVLQRKLGFPQMTRSETADAQIDSVAVRHFVVNTSMDHLGTAQLEFQESLFALHQEIDHFKVDNEVSSKNNNCPLLAMPQKAALSGTAID